MSYWLLIPICMVIFTLTLAYIKKVEQLKRYKLIERNYEDKFLIATNELKDIASLNKYVTERWESSVKENKALNDQNYNLLRHIQDLESKIQ